MAAKNGADLIKIQTYEPKDITINSKEKKFIIKKCFLVLPIYFIKLNLLKCKNYGFKKIQIIPLPFN